MPKKSNPLNKSYRDDKKSDIDADYSFIKNDDLSKNVSDLSIKKLYTEVRKPLNIKNYLDNSLYEMSIENISQFQLDNYKSKNGLSDFCLTDFMFVSGFQKYIGYFKHFDKTNCNKYFELLFTLNYTFVTVHVYQNVESKNDLQVLTAFLKNIRRDFSKYLTEIKSGHSFTLELEYNNVKKGIELPKDYTIDNYNSFIDIQAIYIDKFLDDINIFSEVEIEKLSDTKTKFIIKWEEKNKIKLLANELIKKNILVSDKKSFINLLNNKNDIIELNKEYITDFAILLSYLHKQNAYTVKPKGFYKFFEEHIKDFYFTKPKIPLAKLVSETILTLEGNKAIRNRVASILKASHYTVPDALK